MWNHDMSTAPLGKEVTVTRIVKGEERQFREHHIAPVWLATADGKVHRSYWIPAMKTSKGRWSGFSEGEQPIAWQDFIVPVHPDVEDAEDLAALEEHEAYWLPHDHPEHPSNAAIGILPGAEGSRQ